MEERRMRTDDQPQAKLSEQMHAVAFQAHPYRVPVIGWMNDLEAMTVQDARDWYERWYVPNNAYVVVVGEMSITRKSSGWPRDTTASWPRRGRFRRASRRRNRSKPVHAGSWSRLRLICPCC